MKEDFGQVAKPKNGLTRRARKRLKVKEKRPLVKIKLVAARSLVGEEAEEGFLKRFHMVHFRTN